MELCLRAFGWLEAGGPASICDPVCYGRPDGGCRQIHQDMKDDVDELAFLTEGGGRQSRPQSMLHDMTPRTSPRQEGHQNVEGACIGEGRWLPRGDERFARSS